jgi:hypothetical protein
MTNGLIDQPESCGSSRAAKARKLADPHGLLHHFPSCNEKLFEILWFTFQLLGCDSLCTQLS